MQTIGTAYRLTLFGESHGHLVGVVVDGVPPGVPFSQERVQKELDLRRPGQSHLTTTRGEKDRVEVLSGIHEGVTTGAPVMMKIDNEDRDSSKYEDFRTQPRPGHSDFPAHVKFGGHNDLRGGGMFSARLTAGIVMAGALARMVLDAQEIRMVSRTVQVHEVRDRSENSFDEIVSRREDSATRCVDEGVALEMEAAILQARKDGDSLGGVVETIVEGVPVGLGEPIFDTVEGELARMMYAIPAIKGVEFGAGFGAVSMKGSEHNDVYELDGDRVVTGSNNAGGILGGMATGMPIVFRCAVKPTSSITGKQQTLNLDSGKVEEFQVKGRHDPCVVPRAVPVIENATAVVILDLMLRGGFL